MASTSSNIIQTAPCTPSSSFSKPQSKYEVFLSFRGADTRNTFTDHLYHALDSHKGIRTFRDDEDLEMGRPIKPELLDAIETSRMAVIILSSGYASSSWCLEELAKIIECMKERGMRVLPVFYHLDPRVVRYQIGSFKDAFAEHEKRFEEKMTNVKSLVDEGQCPRINPESSRLLCCFRVLEEALVVMGLCPISESD
ncbi:toll/interleukin-1 receptor-like protein [Alnus glutinosa]|uniref:toll/interleukin-1 receptor-like protein n=1 Tax=Alnus glutinosa TaxID=3517 RepID=UPI002D76A10F|nr:toll/interleukin-1 receptor-like protein [Alnus glutinosa]